MQYEHEMQGTVIFVSHQWLGFNDPDPEGTQWRALRSILNKLISGQTDVEANWMMQLGGGDKSVVKAAEWKALEHSMLWVDYACVDQDDVPSPAVAAAWLQGGHHGWLWGRRRCIIIVPSKEG